MGQSIAHRHSTDMRSESLLAPLLLLLALASSGTGNEITRRRRGASIEASSKSNAPRVLKPRVLPEFHRFAHDLRSGNITILDRKTFLIPDLHYDGLGPDAYFRVGPGPEPDASVKNPPGQKIPNELGSYDVLRAYTGQTIRLRLPDDLTVDDIGWLAVWCDR